MITTRPWLLSTEARGDEYTEAGTKTAFTESLLGLDERVSSSETAFLSVKETQISWIEGVLNISF